MGKVTTGATMSLDAYIAGPGDRGFDLLFQWYGNGTWRCRRAARTSRRCGCRPPAWRTCGDCGNGPARWWSATICTT